MENKKKNKVILIIPVVIIIAIIAALIYYFGYYSKTEQLYKRVIGRTIDSYFESAEEIEAETFRADIDLDMNLETDSPYIDQDILDLVNNVDIKIGTQIDNVNKQLVVDLESDYNKQDLLNLKGYLDVDNKETYIYAKDFLDKYIKVDLDDEDYVGLDEFFTTGTTEEDKENNLNAVKILKEEITNIVKPEYCSSSKEEVTINGDVQNATKNTIKMTAKQFANEIVNCMESLKNNEELWNYCNEEEKELLIEQLDDVIEEAKSLSEDSESENVTIQVNMYTTGLLQKVGKIDIEIYDAEEKILISFVKATDNEYSYEIKSNEELILNGNIKIQEEDENKGVMEVTLEMENLGKLTLKLGYSQQYNIDVDKVDVSNSVEMNSITEADQMILKGNLQNSKLYELIQKFAVKFSS